MPQLFFETPLNSSLSHIRRGKKRKEDLFRHSSSSSLRLLLQPYVCFRPLLSRLEERAARNSRKNILQSFRPRRI